MRFNRLSRALAIVLSVAMIMTTAPTTVYAGTGQTGTQNSVQADEVLPEDGTQGNEALPNEGGQDDLEIPQQQDQEAPQEDQGALPEDDSAESPAFGGKTTVHDGAKAGLRGNRASEVSFIDLTWEGSKLKSETRDEEASPLPESKSIEGGWYYLDRNVTVDGRMCFTGNADLILGDGNKLDVEGLYVPKGSTLTIYAQSNDKDTAGQIYSHPDSGAAIGAYSGHKGGSIVIKGGTITAEGHDHCAGIGGNDDDRKDLGSITIYGGTIDATGGGSGAGIGGGRACEGGNITIYGGDVTAEGGHYGAGIGGGNGQDTNPMRGAHGGTITIWGGKVTATGGDDGAGIGGGEGGNAGNITIKGGTVTAQGGNNSAGIGCGEAESTGNGGSVTIEGGTVTATGGDDAAGIGGGNKGHCTTITIDEAAGAETDVTATGGENGAGIGAGRDADGGDIVIKGGTVNATGTDSSAGIGGGDASDDYEDYSTIDISGGTITAIGHSKGAGIGGGEYGHATVTITGGKITATGGSSGGAGIGNGKDGKGSAVILGYTEETQDDISITASSYKGIVTLNQPFRTLQKTFRETSSVSDLAGLASDPPLTAWTDAGTADAVNVSSWTQLQDAIDDSNKALTATLTQNISANGDSIIRIPSGKNVTIDLNGKEMNRQLNNCVDNGGVLRVEPNAVLTVIDSSGDDSGLITGGASWNGGGICNHGTLYFKGGTVRGNKAINSTHGGGGAIYSSRLGDSDPDAALYITGGVIEGNTARNGGGVYISKTSSAEISDTVISGNTVNGQGGGIYSDAASLSIEKRLDITGNTKGSNSNNVYFCDGRLLTIKKALESDTEIGVTMANTSGNITSGLKGKGGAGNFSSDSGDYTVKTDGNKEAYLYRQADATADSWTKLQEKINSSSDGDVIELTGDVINTDKKDRIKVDNKNVTIDLKGQRVDRNRTSETGDGHVFELMNSSTLTIRDSEGGGVITGGYSKRGGGIYVGEDCTCIITGGSVSGNNADVDGGGIYVKGTLKMTGGSVTSNTADDTGGGIYVTSGGRIELTGADISHNESDNEGGGLKIHLKSDSTITRCKITYNESGNYGGGLHFDASGRKLTVTDTNIDHNTSDDDGAGIYLRYGTIVMNSGSLSNNYSKNDGGGAKITKSTTFIADGVAINSNTTRDEEGGGIKTFGETTLRNCAIKNNKANKEGGGIFNDNKDGAKGDLTLENCTIVGNSTKKTGGGVYSDKKLTVIGGSITGNNSSGRGGGIFIGDDSDDTYIGGDLVVKDNGATAGGDDIFLRTHKLVLKTALTEEAEIGITKENDSGLGTFTKSYSTYNGTKDPALYFFSPEGLDIFRGEGGEASLGSAWSDLRSEIANASNGDTITLTHNCTASSKDGCLYVPENKKNITIDLAGFTLNRNRTSSDGDGHVIWVKDGSTVTIKDSTATDDKPGTGTITGGYSKRGGGIYVGENAVCTVEGINIKKNKASDDGAGLYVKGTLDMTNCVISDNVAEDSAGGIDTEDTAKLTLNNVVITKNAADDDGGGLYLSLKSDSSITGGEISGNRAKDNGGAFYMDAKEKKLTISNTAIDGNSSGDDGAGILLNNGTIEMNKGSISGNETDNDGGGIKVTSKTTFTAKEVDIKNNKANSEEGGGLKNYGTTTLTECTISGNSAGKQGGGIFNDNDGGSAGDLTLDACTITGNSSQKNGGGVYSDKKLTIKANTTIGTTDSEDKDAANNAEGKGGGIFIGKDASQTCIEGKLIIENNTAGIGYDVYLNGSQKLKLTGVINGTRIGSIDMYAVGVFTDQYSDYHSSKDPSEFFGLSLNSIPVEWYKDKNGNNKEAKLHSNWPELQDLIDEAADDENDGIVTLEENYMAGSLDYGLEIKSGYDVTIDLNGHILNRNLRATKLLPSGDVFSMLKDAGHVIEVYDGATLTIKDSSATGDKVESLITGGYAFKGGGIYINEGGTLNVENGAIMGNFAKDHGGGILNYGTLNMTGGIVSGNSAEDNGAGIYTSDSSSMSLENVFISNNTAGDDGGGLHIHLDADTATIKNCTITENSAADNGGGFRMNQKGKTLTITNTKIEKNKSIDDGGGFYLNNGTVVMNGGSLSGNSSYNDSGGAKITDKTTFIADGVDIKNNKSMTEEGGAVKNFGKTTLKNCKITGNSAVKQGGALYNNDDTMTLENCTIQDNNSQDVGGGVYSNEKLKLIGGTISGNTARNKGGGVYIGKDSKDTSVEGKLVIKDNKADNFGNNLYMRKGRKLTVTGAFVPKGDSEASQGTEIFVDIQSGTGVLAKDYKKYNEKDGAVINPDQYFKITEGYHADVNKNGEAEIFSDWSDLEEKIEEYSNGDDPIKLEQNYTASSSDDRLRIEDDKDITIDLNGHIINRNRFEETDDGHVLEVFEGSKLTITDSSATTDKPGTGTIMGGWSERGGGVYVNEGATFDLQSGTITGNRADTNGGGVFVRGTFNMKGGLIKGNKTDGSGGGTYQEKTGRLYLEGGKITENDAEKNGGGIFAKDGARTYVKGSPDVSENHTASNGHDIYLPKGGELYVNGAFAEGANLAVALEDTWGPFTSGFRRFNENEPDQYFSSTEGYAVTVEDDEAAMRLPTYGKSDYEDPFISRGGQMSADTESLGSQNWMSGLSGELYLNDINIPGSHDSGMNNVWKNYNAEAQLGLSIASGIIVGLSVLTFITSLILAPFTAGASLVLAFSAMVAFTTVAVVNFAVPTDWTSGLSILADSRGSAMAKTQYEYIDQQLDDGARQIDVRLNNRKKEYHFLGGSDGPNGWSWEDDGRNLWLCHGKSGGGTYQAQDHEGDYLSLDQTLTWVKDFLEKHPTETIMLDLRPETEEPDYIPEIYQRTKKILKASALQINPSTEEPFLYKEPGSNDYFAPYTHMPKLADCRGKIVIMGYTDDFVNIIGGFERTSLTEEDLDILDFQNTKQMMVEQVQDEYGKVNGDGHVKLQTPEDGPSDRLWYWELNCTGEKDGWTVYIDGDCPHENADYVNPRLIGDEKTFGPDRTGQYIGWVKMDSFAAKYAEPIWRTNFYDGLDYCTVTVDSGMDDPNYPVQTYKVQKGTKIKVPKNIYKQLDTGRYFDNWKAEAEGSGDSNVFTPGETFKVEENVTFTAQWLREGSVPVRILWKDCDDADKLRPDSVDLKVSSNGRDSVVTLTNDEEWSGVITGANTDSTTITPDWDLIDTSDGDPQGQDTEGQYRYETSIEGGDGYTITFIHTPQTKLSVSGTVVWEDKDNDAGKRPANVKVHLLKGEDEVDSRTVTADGNWQYDFGEYPQYENGEQISYSVTEDEIEDYNTVIDEFSITNTYAPITREMISARGIIEWNDAGDAKGLRPEKITLTLLADGEEVDSKTIDRIGSDAWDWNFDELPETNAEGKNIVYTIMAETVDGYTVTWEAVDPEFSDAKAGTASVAEDEGTNMFRVLYTLDVTDDEKEPAAVSLPPESRGLTYNGEEQTLIKKGEAEGGRLLYALGEDADNPPDASKFSAELPVGTEAGTYHVWYYAKGDILHNDTEPECLTVTIYCHVAYIKQNADLTWPEDASEAPMELRPGTGESFSVTEAATGMYSDEHYVLKGYSTEYNADGDCESVYEGQTIGELRDVDILYLYYELEHHTLTFYSDTEGTDVLKTENVYYGESMSEYKDVAPPERPNDTFAAWATEPVKGIHSYTEQDEETINPKLDGKLVDWDNLTLTEDMAVYPVWIHDRLEVHIDLGAEDAELDPKQATDFVVNLDEKIAMHYLKDATRPGYELAGYYTQGGVLWNGEGWADLDYIEPANPDDWNDETAGWGVTPEYCDKKADGSDLVQINEARKFKYYTVTLTAHWTPIPVSVEYDPGEGDGSITDARTYGLGDTVTIPPEKPVVPENRTFIGWTLGTGDTLYSPGGSFVFDDWSLVQNGKLTLTAQYIDTPTVAITFDTDGGTAVAPITAEAGMIIDEEPVTEKAGYIFAGWYDGDTLVTFPFDATESKTLKAKWNVNQYTITFDSAGGSEVSSITAEYKTAITAPEDPTKAHYEFKGWIPALPETMPAENITVKASWAPISYKITFDSNGGSEVADIVGIYGAPVAAPEDPTREGYTFVGWLDKDAAAATLPTYMPDTLRADVTDADPMYTARWKRNQEAPEEAKVTVVNAHTVTIEDPAEDTEYLLMPAGKTPADTDWSSAKRVSGGDSGVEWTNLLPNEEYEVWARRYETENKSASEAVRSAAAVKTPKADQEAPAAPSAKAISDDTIIVSPTANGAEYALVTKGAVKVPESAWISPDENGTVQWTGLAPDTVYDVYARMKAGDRQNVSDISEATEVRTLTEIRIEGAEVVLSETAFTYNGEVQKPSIETVNGLTLQEGTDYTAEWSDASSTNAGTYTVTVTGKGRYKGTAEATYTIDKAANTLKVKGKAAKVKSKKLAKKAQTLKVSKVIKFTKKGQGKKTYKLVSVKKGKKNFKKKFKINKRTGKVTVKKKLKKGTYKVTVKVKANGDANYKASTWKKVTFKVKIK